jgi:rare lipoprotein A
VVYDSGASGEVTANGEIYQADALTAAHKTLPLPSLVQVTNLDNGRTVTVRVNDRGPFVDSQLVELSRGAGAALGINSGDVIRVRVQIKADESRELAAWFAAADRLKQNPPVLPGTDTAELPKLQHQVVIGPQFAALDGAYVADPRSAGNPGADTAAAANQPLVANADELGVPLDLTRLTAAGRPVLLLSLQGRTGPDPATVNPVADSNRPGIYVQAGAFRQVANAKRLRDDLADLGDVSLVVEPWNGGEVNCVRLGPLASATDAQHVMDELTDRGYRDSWLLVE